jgi:hypothetical protein
LQWRFRETADGTAELPSITLKSLQNLRIGHALMLLAFWACHVLR